MSDALQITVCNSMDRVGRDEWNRLVQDNNPFLKHEFLSALERHQCASALYGWHPRHLLVKSAGRLIAAMPLYLKENSYGEFVFDFAWADAYQRNGMAYYPKLVSSIPYTPAQGQRLLLAPGWPEAELRKQVSIRLHQLASEEGASSVHWLFVDEGEMQALSELNWMTRIGVQFHWENREYAGFDNFLADLNSRRRKGIRRERRIASGHGLDIRILHGDQVSDAQWQTVTRLYAKTFEERYSLPTLNFGFFKEIGKTLGRQVVVILAYRDVACVAMALLFRSDTTLYGRHWGCDEDFDCLHFELCYYQGIEYAINKGLSYFEPGAQGEHKIWRGFLPTYTYSSHWISDPIFARAIDDFLQRETPAMKDYKQSLDLSSPFRKVSAPAQRA